MCVELYVELHEVRIVKLRPNAEFKGGEQRNGFKSSSLSKMNTHSDRKSASVFPLDDCAKLLCHGRRRAGQQRAAAKAGGRE